MPSDEPIRARVARILNSRELVINRGRQDGVELGMRFVVLSDAGEGIEDPDTGELLGSVYRPKVEVEIVTLEERLAIARTFRASRVNVGGMGVGGLGTAGLFDPPKWVTRHETLKTEEKTWEDLDESKSFVKTGDPVMQMVGPDEGTLPTHVSGEGRKAVDG